MEMLDFYFKCRKVRYCYISQDLLSCDDNFMSSLTASSSDWLFVGIVENPTL